MNMTVLANLKFQGSSPVLEHLTEFPETPQDGHMTLINGVVYMYTTLRGMSTWYPLTNEKNYFVQTQGLASTTWNINHNLNTSDFVFFAYDENNNLIQPDYEYVNDDAFKLNFTVARKGKVVIFYAVDALNVDKSYGIKKLNFVAEQDQTLFEIGDSLFVFDYIDVYLNGIKLNETEYAYDAESITLNSGVNAGDYLSVTTYGQVDFREIGTRKEEFVAEQDQTVFTTDHIQGQTDVFVNGILLNDNEFTDTASDITLNVGLNAGDVLIAKMYDTVNSLDNYTQIEVDQKVNTDDIVDAVDTTYTAKPLSANQGRILKGLIDNINILLASDDVTLNELQEVVDFIKLNREDLETLTTASIAGLDDALNNLQIDVDSKIGPADYATPTVGGTVKLRRDGDTLYITTDGSDA
jgi:hypothetical protein